MQKKFKVVTLGCRTNQYESQAFHDQMVQMGHLPAKNGEKADICIVNTCTVTESADRSSRHQIRQLARENSNAKIFVTGCSAENQPEKLLAIPGVTSLVRNHEKEELLSFIFPDEELPEFKINQFEAHTRAFVKVQDGCNSFCTYCTIPYVRGRSRSRSITEIVSEVESLIENGFKEVVLTGINIGDFNGGDKDTLADLVRAVDKVPGLERLRISSIDPDEVDDDLIEAILSGKNTCRSMHIVLQSGSNVILKRMNRKYTRQIFYQTIDRLRAAASDFTFTTDVIVGFPGETERDFEETLEVMQEVKFTDVHMFPFSPRPRTRAALMPNQISQEVIRERKQKVMHLSERIAYELREKYIGRRLKILTERHDKSDAAMIGGHTDNFLMVWVEGSQYTPNQLLDVECIENTPKGLLGKIA